MDDAIGRANNHGGIETANGSFSEVFIKPAPGAPEEHDIIAITSSQLNESGQRLVYAYQLMVPALDRSDVFVLDTPIRTHTVAPTVRFETTFTSGIFVPVDRPQQNEVSFDIANAVPEARVLRN